MRRPALGLVLGLVLIAAGAWSGTAWAHPHVFIDYRVEPQARDGAIVGLRLIWRFDELYSSLVMDSVDADHDGKLSQTEIDAIAARTLKNAESNRFYSHFTLDGEAWQTGKAQHFSATIDGERVSYVFTIALPRPVRALSVSGYDPEYYIEMVADKRQPGTAEAACKVTRGPPVKTQSWGSFTPDIVTCAMAGH